MVRVLVLLVLAGVASYAATRIVARREALFDGVLFRSQRPSARTAQPRFQDAADGIEVADKAAEEETFPQRKQALDELRSEMKHESV